MDSSLLDKFDKVSSKAALISIQRGVPIPLSKTLTMVGSLSVKKNDNGEYDIISQDGNCLYQSISAYDVAIVIAQRILTKEVSIINEVLELEHKFSKYHTDMIHYLHCMKSAKKNNDFDRLSILEDKFQTAELSAKVIKSRIALFKRVK